MNIKSTLGENAYFEYSLEFVDERRWIELPDYEKQSWEKIANSVADVIFETQSIAIDVIKGNWS
jgi:hypothetical protein